MEDYNLDFQSLCDQLDMKLLSEPRPLTGGLLHQMFRLETDKGVFAAKALNPEITARPEAAGNYRSAESIARTAEAAGIPALPALQINGDIFVKTAGQVWMLFPWAEGKALADDQITPAHCLKIGRLLRQLHGLTPSAPTMLAPTMLASSEASEPMEDNWADFLAKGKAQKADWAPALEKMLPALSAQTAAVNAAAPILSRKAVLSHRDLDPKNVLWQQESPLLIDWEAAGPVNPLQELLDDALYWSDNGRDTERFAAMLAGYSEAGKPDTSAAECRAAADGLPEGRLGWLQYNLRRALGELGDSERALGEEQVLLTLAELEALQNQMKALMDLFIQTLS